MAQATFTTPTVHCMSCMATIEDAVTAVDGVRETEGDLDALKVRVAFDAGRVDAAHIAEVIAGAGYDVTAIS